MLPELCKNGMDAIYQKMGFILGMKPAKKMEFSPSSENLKNDMNEMLGLSIHIQT